jgi:hypothetical protein
MNKGAGLIDVLPRGLREAMSETFSKAGHPVWIGHSNPRVLSGGNDLDSRKMSIELC